MPTPAERLQAIEAMIAKKPDDPFAHYARAMALRSADQKEAALEAFRGVAERFPDYVPTYLMAAQLAADLARPADARALAERGAERAAKAGDGHALSELRTFLGTLS